MCDYCNWVKQILEKIYAETTKQKAPVVDPVIIVHGGAGRIPQNVCDFMMLGVKDAAVEAYNDLLKGCSSVDAVEKAIMRMESLNYFNCAKGGSLDESGEITMDAGIMTVGYSAGCVGAVRNIEHPITLAKKVLEETGHVLIVEEGAERLALEHGIPILPPKYLVPKISEQHLSDDEEEGKVEEEEALNTTKKKRKKPKRLPQCLRRLKPIEEENSKESVLQEDSTIGLEIGAVGAVAYDRKKRLASGSSTAGKTGRLIGYVSPVASVIGCGIFVNENGGAAVSGDDELLYFHAPARKLLNETTERTPVHLAMEIVLEDFVKSTKTRSIGAIAISEKGDPSISFKTPHFPWAYCQRGTVYYGCKPEEKYTEVIEPLTRPLDCMCQNFP